MRIHRRHDVRMSGTRTVTGRRRRQHRTEAVVVEAEVAGTVVVTYARTDADNHPRLVVIAVPAETHWLEVFEDGKAVELVAQFIVRHHRVSPRGIRTVSRDGDLDPLDGTRAHSHVLGGIAVTIIGIEVDVEIATISVISNILNIIVDGDRIGVIGQHWL